MKKLIPTICMTLLGLSVVATSSYAWFSMNKTVTATGMSVKATSSESLVIDTDHAVTTDITVSLSAFGNELTPISYMDSTYKYNTNPEAVSTSTGLAQSTDTPLTFAECEGSDDGKTTVESYYYHDYIVYLAASGQAMTNKTLTATATFGTATKAQNAITVAYSVLEVASSDVAEQPVALAPVAKSTAADDSGVGKQIATGLSLPLNTSNTSIPVVMRVYVDGALLDTAGKAYVNTDNVNTDALTISVAFTVSNPAA